MTDPMTPEEALQHKAELAERQQTGVVGKMVTMAVYSRDSSGYPYVTLKFDDGTVLFIRETGQAGDIEVALDGTVLPEPSYENCP